jgi:hypothetical protein
VAKPSRCARCGRENDASFAFCLDCGAPLRPPAAAAPTCAACGGALQPGFRFCGLCGAPAGATPAPPSRARAGAPPTPAPPPGPPALPQPGSGRLRIAALRSDGQPGTLHPLDGAELVCGRTEGALRIADDPTVSPRHARFSFEDGALRVEDLGSANGTFVRIREPRAVGAGEELRVGRQLLRLEPQPPRPAEEGGARAWGAPDPGCRWRLAQLLEDGGVGDVFPLRDGDNVLGREGGDVAFPRDRYVSGRHARLEVRADRVVLSDLGSSNGTFVRLAAPLELGPGDQLLVGAQLLRVDA